MNASFHQGKNGGLIFSGKLQVSRSRRDSLHSQVIGLHHSLVYENFLTALRVLRKENPS